jgi:peptidoglycan endopeptidase LytE
MFIFYLRKNLLAKELSIVLVVLTFLIFMPIFSVFALTHVKSEDNASHMYNAVSYPGDLYAWGNCTWWVSIRRSQINDPIPNSWGNAATWAERAAADGYLIDHNPTPGSIMQISNVDGGLGHVAFVESVDNDGTWHISEMNVLGLDVVDYKAEPASVAVNYNFIHDKEGL